jgi:acetyl-CoA carboxylase biotin carboxyl carrier protein
MDIDEMVENDLSEIMLRDGEKRSVLRRGAHGMRIAPVAHAPAAPLAATPAAPAPAAAPVEDPTLAEIKSPMVGTFYSASDPTQPPFVKVGDAVSPDTVVCIIEAMKVFNEIKADVAGTVEAVCVHNASPVEFGQVLLKVRTRPA